MQSLWFSNLPKSEQENFKKLVLGSKKVLDRLHEICYNTIQDEVKVSDADYDSASWAYKQAHRNGYLAAYRELLLLTEISDKEGK